MTQVCTTCHDDTCPHMGKDGRACEHYVRLSDVDPQPVVTNPPDGSRELRVDCPFHDQCSEIVTRLRKVERALCDIGRAVDGELL
jgi:predicted RNA methylase